MSAAPKGARHDPSRLLTMKEAANRLCISVKTLRGHIRNGRLRYVNVGLGEFRPRYRFEESDLIDSRKQTDAATRRQQSHVALSPERLSLLSLRFHLAR